MTSVTIFLIVASRRDVAIAIVVDFVAHCIVIVVNFVPRRTVAIVVGVVARCAIAIVVVAMVHCPFPIIVIAPRAFAIVVGPRHAVTIIVDFVPRCAFAILFVARHAIAIIMPSSLKSFPVTPLPSSGEQYDIPECKKWRAMETI